MKFNILVFLIVVIVFFIIINICTLVGYGGVASNETQEKYLRNIGKYQPIENRCHQMYISIFECGDSLTFIAKTAYYPLSLPWKYYINDVGLIPVGSKLHHAIDSMASVCKKSKNKLK